MKKGLNAVCVTEHSTIRGAEVCQAYARKMGFRVLKGMEVYTDCGDMLVFGWEGRVKYYLVPFEEIRDEVKKVGGKSFLLTPSGGFLTQGTIRASLWPPSCSSPW